MKIKENNLRRTIEKRGKEKFGEWRHGCLVVHLGNAIVSIGLICIADILLTVVSQYLQRAAKLSCPNRHLLRVRQSLR